MSTISKKPFPILELNPALILREHTISDAQDFLDYYTNPKVHQHILAKPAKNLLEAESEIMYCRNLYYNNQGIYWCIARRDNNKMIGAIGVYINYRHRRAELCYDLAEPYWGQGVISDAIGVIKQFLFYQHHINRIEAITLNDNPASIAVLIKQGFQHEGHLKHYKFFDNKSHDVEIYAVTKQG